MNWHNELDQLVQLCSKRSKKTMLRRFPKEENEPLAEQIRYWLKQHANNPDIASDQIKKLRDFLIFHEAASQGPIPTLVVRSYIVIDTNIFFHHENILDQLDKNCVFVLPQIVLDELINRAKTKDAKSRQSQRVLDRIRLFPKRRTLLIDVSSFEIQRFLLEFPTKTRNDLCDYRILAAAKRLLGEKKPTQLLSDDVALREKAIESGIPTLSLREFLADW